MIYLSLIQNIAFLVALAFVHSLLLARLKKDGLVYPLFSGLLFGCLCIIGMITPVSLLPGIIFDGRSIILSVAGLFGGPLTALVAVAISAAYRFLLGGIGALPGAGVIICTASFGVAWYYLRRRHSWAMRTPGLLLFGLLVHLLMLAILLLTLPAAVGRMTISQMALPLLLLYPPATLLVCLLFQMVEQHIASEQILKSSENRMRLFFERQLVGMAITSPQMRWVQVNDKICQMLGYTREELVLLSWTKLTHPDDLAEDLANFNRLLSAEIDEYSLEKRFIHKNGAMVNTNISVGCVRHPDGSVDYVLVIIEDISKRKEMEQSLRETNELFSLLMRHSPVCIFIKEVTSSGSRVLQASENFREMIGIPGSEMLGKSMEDLFPAEFAAKITADDRAVVAAGEVLRLDENFNGRNYTTIKFPLVQGGRTVLAGYTIDVTERRMLDVKLEEDQRFLQTILDAIADLVFYKDRNSIFLGCNDAYASRYIGLPKERIIGHSDSDFIPDRQMVSLYVESDRQVMESGRPVLLKPWITLANGQKTLVEVLKSPFYDAAGHVAGVIGVARDITEHQLALDAIKLAQETTQRYLDVAGVMFCALNRVGEIILINKKGAQILGYREDQLLGRNWFDVCLPEPVREKVRGVFALQLAGNLAPVEFYENSVLNSNGEERLIAFHNTLLHDDQGISGVLFSGEDITEKRIMQDELHKNQKLESLGVLAGGIAHDLNNILTGMMGNISFARMSLRTPERAEKLLEKAEQASLRAASLANQLLTFAKGGKPVKKRVSVGHLLNESLSLSLRGTNVKGVVEISDALHDIEADEGQLSQVFNNLIINAVQAMPGGGILTVRGDNCLLGEHNRASLPPGNYVVISFVDQGCGIPPEVQKKIFDPYFTTKASGSGLGLASAYSIVSNHGGCLDVHSELLKGATFTMYLPSLGTAIVKKDTGKVSLPTVDQAGRSILVMDDEQLILDLAAELLMHLGYQVTTCVSGELAIILYKAAMEAGVTYFAAILDLTIPGGIGGLEAARQILAYDPSASLIVSSGYSNDPVISDYRSFGFRAAVSKPYNVDAIIKVLDELTGRS